MKFIDFFRKKDTCGLNNLEATDTIPELNLYGARSIISPNNRFKIIWSADGRIFCFKKSKLTYEGKLDFPENGRVADNGTFVLSDRKRDLDEPNGMFYCFQSSGQEVVRYPLKAPIYSVGLSEDGRRAVCQTLNSPSEDGDMLCFFDLELGELLWKKPSETAWADVYQIDMKHQKITLLYEEGVQYCYDFEGNFLDHDLLNQHCQQAENKE